MTQTIQIVMTGQLPSPPYQSVFWTVYGEPDNTGALSGYGAGFLLNIGVDSITVLGNQVDPLSLQVGGDLTGNLPNPYVSGLQGKPISTASPVTNQVLTWSGSAWTPTTDPGFTATPNPTPNTVVLRDSGGGASFSADGGVTYLTINSRIIAAETGTFLLTQSDRTSDAATHTLNIFSQGPFAAATGTNRLPGDMTFNIPPAAGALAATTTGNYNFKLSNVNHLIINGNPSVPETILTFPQSAQFLGVKSISTPASNDLLLSVASASNIVEIAFAGVSALNIAHNASTTRLNTTEDLILAAGGPITVALGTGDNLTISNGTTTVTLGNAPSVTGAKGGNAALTSLLSVLATAGIITDNTT